MKKIILLLILMPVCFIDAKKMRMKDVEDLLTQPTMQPVPAVPVDQKAVIQRLDEQLSAPVETAWDDRINDLFDLAMVNRELARQYFIKIRQKMDVAEVKPIEVVVAPVKKEEEAQNIEPVKGAEEKSAESTLPAGEEPMKKATGRPAPPRKPGAPKVEPSFAKATEGGSEESMLPSGEEPMKKGTAPAPKKGAPKGGPAKNLGGAAKGAAKPTGAKEAAPKVAEQIYSGPKFQQLDNDKLLELFNDLLEKLGSVPTNWNGMAVEKVEEKTKYGSKVYNVYGAPVGQWTNNINTLKKVIVSKNVMPEAEASKKIADRIVQVRAEKAAVKPAAATAPEEKPKEELTEDNLVKAIKAQLADPKPELIGWAVSTKGNIKALDKLNHDAALIYHDQFIKLMKEKPFLK